MRNSHYLLDPRESVTLNSFISHCTQSQETNHEAAGPNLETINNQSVSKGPEGHQGQENLPQRIRNQAEIDSQITYQLQAEEYTRRQQHSTQTANRTGKDYMNQEL